ncbi:MAG: hypothetical protein R3E39_11050 [Anaerolineae bacterium]
MNSITLRPAEPADYLPIIAVVDNWWGGRCTAAVCCSSKIL